MASAAAARTERPPPPRLRPPARLLPPAASACSHAGGSNTRIRDPGPGQDERVQAGSSPPFFPQPGRSRLLWAWRASRKGGGREAGRLRSCRRRDACRLLGPCCLFTPPGTYQPSWEVGSFPASTFSSGRYFSGRWAEYGHPETGGATLNGFDHIILRLCVRELVQGPLFLGGNCTSLPPHPYTHPMHAQHALFPFRFRSCSFLPGIRIWCVAYR